MFSIKFTYGMKEFGRQYVALAAEQLGTPLIVAVDSGERRKLRMLLRNRFLEIPLRKTRACTPRSVLVRCVV